MTKLQKVLKALGFDVDDDKLDIIKSAVEEETKPTEPIKPVEPVKPTEPVKPAEPNKPEGADNVDVKALQEKLDKLEQLLASEKKSKDLDTLLTDVVDKDVVKMLIKDAEKPEEVLKELRTSKAYLFTATPNVKGSDEQKIMDEFEIEYRKEYLS